MNVNLETLDQSLIDLFEHYLKEILLSYNALNSYKIIDAALYSTFSGGKRIRYRVATNYAKIFNIDAKDILPIAAAVEFIHTYSLMHDDLPSMDNDDFRRGAPSCHKMFNESTAILSGCLLKSFANDIIINKSHYSDSQKLMLLDAINKYTGFEGILIGQYIDLNTNLNTIDDYIKLYKYKTSALFSLSFEAINILAGVDKSRGKALGDLYGIIYQLNDDIDDFNKRHLENNICNIMTKNEATLLLAFYNKEFLDYYFHNNGV